MRSAFHDDLDRLSDQLVEMTRLAGSGMARATTALLDADLAIAESVIAADEQVDRIQRELDELALDLLARHVAKVARRRYPESAVPPALRATVLQMGQVAERIVAKAGSVIASKDVAMAVQLEQDDDEMDRLHRELYTQLLGGTWDHGMEAAVDITLVGRYYERFADHAVSVARRVVYLATGVWHESYDPTVSSHH